MQSWELKLADIAYYSRWRQYTTDFKVNQQTQTVSRKLPIVAANYSALGRYLVLMEETVE